MRLHLMPDEKVINNTINDFERNFPGENKYIIILSKNQQETRYCKSRKNVYIVHFNTQEFWNIIYSEKYTHIILHSIWPEIDVFLNKIKDENIYWVAWGGDLYETLERRGYRVYDEKIQKFRARGLPSWLFKILIEFKRRNLSLRIRALHKVKFMATDIDQDVELLHSYFPEAKHIQKKSFFYYPIDSLLDKDLLDKQCTGMNIFVGNSSSIHSNHELIFKKLENLNLNKKKVFTPLSYGDVRYADYVSKLGYDLLPNNFAPIREFMPSDQYYSLFFSGNVFIYGNYRQSAFGNIVMVLYLGGKVFLHEANSLYQFFISIDVKVFSLEELNQNEIDTQLSDSVRKNNRNIIFERYNSKALDSLIKENFK